MTINNLTFICPDCGVDVEINQHYIEDGDTYICTQCNKEFTLMLICFEKEDGE